MGDDDLLLADRSIPFGSGIIGVCDICGKRQAVIVLQKERFKLCVLDFLNKTWINSTTTPGRPLPPYRSERVWFPSDSSSTGQAQGILLTPTKQTKHPGVLVTPDVYGLTTMVLDAGIRLAREGYEVILPDVSKLDGLSPMDHLFLRADARVRGGIRVESPRVRKLVRLYNDALAYLRTRPLVDPTKIAVFGASYGASLGLAVAGENPGLSAVAVAFPLPVAPVGFLRLLNAPVLLVLGGRDGRARRAQQQLESELRPAGTPLETQVYPPAGHLFLARDVRGYDLASAESAWTKTLAFLRDRLVPPPPKPPPPKPTPAGPPSAPPAPVANVTRPATAAPAPATPGPTPG
ncbi:MAG TPA: dienelactone hydrolase family protein [Thermoplasmata archaeon]|nr:dienelactone hydrolase family protein [Thermoplasmata archaeon]